MSARAVAYLLACLAIVLLGACGAAPQAQTVAQPVAADPRKSLPELQRLAQNQQWSQLAARIEATGHANQSLNSNNDEADFRLRELYLQALWRSDRPTQARAMEDELVALVRKLQPVPPAAERALSTNVRLHLRVRHRPEDAWRLLSPLVSNGCETAARCDAALAVLTALPEPAPGPEATKANNLWHMQALQAAPSTRSPDARTRFLIELTERLTKLTRLEAARQLWMADAEIRPLDPTPWVQAYAVARKQPGPAARMDWLRRVQAANVPTTTLLAVGQHPDLLADRDSALQILRTAADRSDAPVQARWAVLTMLSRGDDARGVEALLAAYPPPSSDITGQQVAIRAALRVRLLDRAGQMLPPLLARQPNDAVHLALQADWLRQRGDLEGARRLVAQLASATGDRSLGELLVGQMLRGAMAVEAEAALERAAELPGQGQLPAARLRAQKLWTAAAPTPASSRAVLRYARLLTAATPQTESSPLLDEQEPSPADARAAMVRQLSIPTWGDVGMSVLRSFADARVATASQLRMLAQRSVATDDLDAFLAADARARARADEERTALPSDALLAALAKRGATWLAHWLVDAAPDEVEDGNVAWLAAETLLKGDYAATGRLWLAHARTWHAEVDVSAAMWQTIASFGGASAALDAVQRLRAVGKGQDLNWLQVEATAWVALGDTGKATQVLTAAATRTDAQISQIKQLIDFAGERGLCTAVAALAPKLAAGPGMFSLRSGFQRGIDCARRHRDEAQAQALVRAALGNRVDMTRLEEMGQALAAAGFDALALQLLGQVQWQRPPADDTIYAWARALLAQGQVSQAVTTMQKATATRGRVSRLWLRGAELLEDFGYLGRSVEFYRGAIAVDPDATRLHVRLIAVLLRLGKMEEAGSELVTLARMGPTDEDLHIVEELARRTRAQKPLLDALATVAEADREIERLRAELAADLGDRATVTATVGRMRAKGGYVGPSAIRWLQTVGAIRQARETAEDTLASPEPTGNLGDRRATLQAGLALRLDPGSADEALSLSRLYMARALSPDEAAAEAAIALGRIGASKQAYALAKSWRFDRDLRFVALRARYAWDAGQQDEARQLWAKVRAASLLEPALRDQLRSLRMTNSRDQRTDDLLQAVSWTWADMVDVGLYDEAKVWLDEQLQLAPESELAHTRRIQTLLAAGDVPGAATALATARRVLRQWPAEMASLADRIAREGGAQLLVTTSGDTRRAERTDSWWLALLATLDQHSPPHLQELAAGLARELPDLRTQLALRAAGVGDGKTALQWLGAAPIPMTDDRVDVTVRAMAATLVALYDPSDAAAKSNTQTQLQRWLQSERGVDLAAALAYELVRQGQPALAAIALERIGNGAVSLSPDLQLRRLLATLGAGDDDAVVAASLRFLRGQRSNLTANATGPVRAPSDDVFDWLITAGRVSAARKLASALRIEEPAVAIPPALDDAAGSPLAVRLRGWQPEAIDALPDYVTTLPAEAALDALQAAAARSSTLAVRVATVLAAQADEPWRVWLSLARAAVDLDQGASARTALQRARQAGVPQGVSACLDAALDHADQLSACLAGRPLQTIPLAELGDLAMAAAQRPTVPTDDALGKAFQAASQAARARLIAAAGARLPLLTTTQKSQLAQWLQLQIKRLAPAEMALLGVAAMEDLAALGAGDLGVLQCQLALRNHPTGHGQHNNLAYALHLCGHPTAESLAHARAAERSSGGEAAYAALDTLAAVLLRLGQRTEAIAVQTRALAASLATSADRRPPMALPWARYAELLLANGDVAQARALAAEALRRSTEDEDTRDEPGAVIRLLRVLRDTLQQVPAQPPSPPPVSS